MQPTQRRTSSRLVILLTALLFFTIEATVALAQQSVVFLPLKINAPDPETVQQADKALEKALADKEIRMLSRAESAALIDYNGAWPPPAAALAKLASKEKVDYVAAGSLTRLGEQLSIDFQIFDALSPAAPRTIYQEAQSIQTMEESITAGVRDILVHTGRDFAIASIAPAGNVRIDSGAIQQKISTKAGDPYDPAKLREDLKAVFAMGYFDSVEIEAEETDQGKAILFRIQEKPLISEVTFAGTDAIEEEEVRDAANIQANSILNPNKINEAVQHVKELYKTKGYYNTTVSANLTYPGEDRAVVRFVIQEGSKIYVEKIGFEGNEAFDGDELEDVIETSTWNWLSWLTQSGVLKKEILQQDASRVAAFYHNHGFIDAKVGEPKVQQEGDALSITFPISEGPRYRVGTVDITGDLIEDKEALIARLKIRNEEFLNRGVLREDQLRIVDLYAEQGFAFAEIDPDIKKAAVGKRVDITLRVSKGSLVHFNRIEIAGNTRTRDNVIRRDLEIKEGGLYDSRAIRNSTNKLQRLGFFEEVNITPVPALQDDLMDVNVEVKEKSTGQFSVGAGYSSAEYMMFMGEISESNLMGTGNRLSLAANVSGSSTKFNLGLTNPRLFDTQLSGGVDVFSWAKEYDDYTKDSKGAALRFGHPIVEKWRIYYTYSYTDTELSDVADNASVIIRRSMDIQTESAVRVALVRDTRNKAFNPSEGSTNEVSVKYAGLGGDAEYTKVQGSTAWYFPLFWETTFHVKGAAGEIYTDDQNKLPVYEHFYLGGMNTIRGFKSANISPKDPETGERIGGDKMWYSNLEYIFPLVKDAGLAGVVFTDFGNVYAVDADWDFGEVKKAAGIELRWFSPMGPLRLSWGYNLDPEKDEDDSVWDFSIGGMF